MSKPVTIQSAPPVRDIYFSSREGLRLHARHYPAAPPVSDAQYRQSLLYPVRPLVCLPDLLQNGYAFNRLALYLSRSAQAPRDVYALDFRGRGQSEAPQDWREYTPGIEAEDVLDFLTRINVPSVNIIGTGRGGIIAMLIAAKRPTAFGAFILNDIGPVALPTGLARVQNLAARLLPAQDWEEAGETLGRLGRNDFPDVTGEDWEDVARSYYNEREGEEEAILHPTFDARIQRIFRALGNNRKMPDLWRIFMALRKFPLLALRGELSQHLTEETMQRMAAIHFWCEAYDIPRQGHAPLLINRPTLVKIETFLMETDATSIPSPFSFSSGIRL